MKTLHLHVNFEYFDQIKDGTKKEEYRESDKWKAKLDANNYTNIRIYRGYQKASPETVIDLPYKGYIEKTITHKHFEDKETKVCAIDVSH